MVFAQRRGELAVVAAATRLGRSPRLERAARELLALQSSDWAFQVTSNQAGEYPRERAQQHAAALQEALSGPEPGPESSVRSLQPNLDLSPLVLP
jgi:1,4-alpha-glucan branching enzyme